MKKKKVWLWFGSLVLVGGLLFAGIGCAVSAEESGENPALTPSVQVVPVSGAFDKNTTFTIVGSGFEPGQTIILETQDRFGNPSVVSDFVEPSSPVANKNGAFAVRWTLGRWARGSINEVGLYTLNVLDADFNLQASAPLGYCPKGEIAEGEELPPWCGPELLGK